MIKTTVSFLAAAAAFIRKACTLKRGEGGGGALRNLADAPKKTFFFWECLPKIEFWAVQGCDEEKHLVHCLVSPPSSSLSKEPLRPSSSCQNTTCVKSHQINQPSQTEVNIKPTQSNFSHSSICFFHQMSQNTYPSFFYFFFIFPSMNLISKRLLFTPD